MGECVLETDDYYKAERLTNSYLNDGVDTWICSDDENDDCDNEMGFDPYTRAVTHGIVKQSHVIKKIKKFQKRD